jgi:F-type H+-transporting ATPase subunit gamma
MSDLQALKNRIKNIKNTSKVTKAMKLISANKLKKAVKELEKFRETKSIITDLLANLIDKENFEQLPDEYKKLLKSSSQASSVMLIVISSNKGLCGNFNSALFKLVEYDITILLKEKCEISVLSVGSKASNYFESNNPEFLVDTYSNIQKFELENAELVLQSAMQKFIKGDIDECRIYYNQYVSTMMHPPKCEILFPLNMQLTPYQNLKFFEGSDFIEKVITQHLLNEIIKSLLEAKAGEEAARMTAMDSATNNATKMHSKLLLQYNRTRQASITNEISEIISGSEAL